MTMFFYLAGVDLGNTRVRLGKVPGFAEAAEQGTVSIASVPFDDPTGNLTILGWQPFVVDEPACSRPRIWTGFMADRSIGRGQGDSLITGTARRHDASIADLNVLLGMRVFTAASTNRPAESETARMAWLLGTTQMAGISDLGAISTGVLILDAADFRGQYPIDVLSDMAGTFHRNFDVYYDDAAHAVGLFYADEDAALRTSTLKVSNVLSDFTQSHLTPGLYDSSVGNALPLIDGVLGRDPSRLYSGVYLQYANGAYYGQDATTLSTYFPTVSGGRDFTKTVTRVKTAATAVANVNGTLAETAIEEDRLTFTLKLPAAHVNDWKKGERAQVKFQHLPGYTSYTYVRCVNRTVRQDEDSDQFYNVEYTCVAGAGVQTGGGANGGGGGAGGAPPPTSIPYVPPAVLVTMPLVELNPPHVDLESFSTFGGGQGNDFAWTGDSSTATGQNFGIDSLCDGSGAGVPAISSAYGFGPLWVIDSSPTIELGTIYTVYATGHGVDGHWCTDGDTQFHFYSGGGATLGFYTLHSLGTGSSSGDVGDRLIIGSFYMTSSNPADVVQGPLVGQSVTEYVVNDLSGTVGSPTNWPYLPGSLQVFADADTVTIKYLAAAGPATGGANSYTSPVSSGLGVLQTVTEIDPSVGTFSYLPGTGVSGASLAVLNEGVSLTGAATSMDFVGTAVEATAVGAAVTVTVSAELPIEGGQDTIKAHGNTGSTETFDPTDGNVHTATLNANCTFTLNAPSGTGAATIELYLTQDGTGSRTVTWPGSVVWPGGTAPTLSTAAGSVDRIVLETLNGGTTWYGTQVGGAAGVTSVALTVPTEFSVSGSPITGSGTLAITKANETANTVWAGPTSGSAAAPIFRALVATDIPAGVGVTDHQHIDNVTFSGDGSTTVFELPAAPFDAYSVQAFVAGVKVGQSLSGPMLTTMTFDSAPASGTDNISVDIVATAV